MLNAEECLAHATDMETRAALAPNHARASFLRIAKGWCRVACMAKHQYEWLAHNDLGVQ
jgi:hypothetical protein